MPDTVPAHLAMQYEKAMKNPAGFKFELATQEQLAQEMGAALAEAQRDAQK